MLLVAGRAAEPSCSPLHPLFAFTGGDVHCLPIIGCKVGERNQPSPPPFDHKEGNRLSLPHPLLVHRGLEVISPPFVPCHPTIATMALGVVGINPWLRSMSPPSGKHSREEPLGGRAAILEATMILCSCLGHFKECMGQEVTGDHSLPSLASESFLSVAPVVARGT